jgi:ribosomal protein S18 acetylase RimI-like enzyme
MQLQAASTDEQVQWCASIMADSEPWLTLGRDVAQCLTLLRDPLRETWLLGSAEAPLGFAVLCFAGPFSGYLQVLCVAPQHRGVGVGTALLRAAEQQVFQRSPNCFLCVSSFNTGAIRFYEREGYQRIGELHDYVVRGHSEWLYRKTRGPWADFAS